ncbi:DegV family protein [Fusibacter ferrireducens]|uniref:DegV family protein n=1 Tax=Fusibacter ferrireducens TaxID=2785058 RepID=A0ABR9ZSY0_9FIRM|nr:DegV family protein [Fusibacter ferrireducens]MBF4693579.1 DegV family protein [Fusibacter ferrireducens]
MIKLIADSTCDLSEEICVQLDIGIAPLSITIDGKTYKDRIDIDADTFFSKIAEYKMPPTTAMPSPAVFLRLFDEAYAQGKKEILCICMSRKTSGSYQSALIAKDYFLDAHEVKDYKIHIVDSTSMSHGSGWLVIKSARLINAGKSFEEIVDFVETYKRNVKHFLSVDDLDNLVRSGRLRSTSAFIGKMLKVKPIMSMRDGEGAIVGKERGRKKVLQHYIDAFKERVNWELTDFVIVGYTSDRIYAENLVHLIKSETAFQGDIFLLQMGVAVGTHVGLGGLSFYFLEKAHIHDGLFVNNFKHLKDHVEESTHKLLNKKK